MNDTEIKEEIESLARMVQTGFTETHERLGRVESDIAVLRDDVSVLKDDVAALNMKVTRLDRRMESQADSLYEDMHELKDRTVVLEKKAGIIPPKRATATA